jgi:hypothetical protein
MDYARADDLEHAWLNFELDLPLEARQNGAPNPFYVSRPDNPTLRLQDELASPFRAPPKYFLSGNRGCGKSTELRRIAAAKEIKSRYFPIYFSMRDEADVNNLDYKETLLAMGERLFSDFTKRGGKIPESLERELTRWRGKVMEVIVRGPRVSQVDIEGGLAGFFSNLGVRMKLEPATRREVRQVIENDTYKLMEVINSIVEVIRKQTRKMPLLLIDDLDKPDAAASKEIFCDHREAMLLPECAIVYTVSNALFYMPEFERIRDRAVFVPNVRLSARNSQRNSARDESGYATLREMVHRRIHPDLLAPRVVDEAVRISGGVFGELARVMRASIAQAQRTGVVQLQHVLNAEAEIRAEYRRMLTAEQRAMLREVRLHKRIAHPAEMVPLLQMLAVMEYADSEAWCDVHPALVQLLDEEGKLSSKSKVPSTQ